MVRPRTALTTPPNCSVLPLAAGCMESLLNIPISGTWEVRKHPMSCTFNPWSSKNNNWNTPPRKPVGRGTYSWLGIIGGWDWCEDHFLCVESGRSGEIDINDGIKPEEFQETCSWCLISVFFKKYWLHCWWPASMLALMCQIGLHDRARRPVGKLAFERDLMQNESRADVLCGIRTWN